MVSPLSCRLALLASLAAAAACTDFASPAELLEPTVLAVIAGPPVVAPGGQPQLSVVIADGGGELTGLPARWSLVELTP